MRSKTSWINHEIMKQINHSVGWIGIIYFLILLFALPLQVLMLVSEDNDMNLRHFESLFKISTFTQIILVVAVPVVLSVFLFRYMQVKPSSDLMHSLPIKRENVFYHYSLAGFFYLLVPIFFTSLIMYFQYIYFDLGTNFEMKDIFIWAGTTSLITVLIYMAGLFIGMLTGLSVVQGVLTYIFLLFPSGILLLICMNMTFFLSGFPSDFFLNKQIEKYSPLLKLSTMDQHIIGPKEIALYLILIIVLFLLSLLLYKKRKLEGVSQALAFPVLRPIFVYCVTFCTMLLGGAYFGQMQNKWSWTVFGYVVGTLIGYCVAEMLLQKSWRITLRWRNLATYTVAVIILGALFHWDIFQYEKKIPALADIEKVHFSDGFYAYSDHQSGEINKPNYLKDTANIKRVREFQKAVISNEKGRHFHKPDENTAFIVYQLKNGKRIIRQYKFDKKDYNQYLEPIYESKEYKKTTNDILNVKNESAEKITLAVVDGPINRKVTITDPGQIQEAMAMLKNDILDETYEEMNQSGGSFYQIAILLNNNKTLYLNLLNTYDGFKQWLNKRELFNKIEITTDDVSYILIAKDKDLNLQNDSNETMNEKFRELEKAGKAVRVKSKDELEHMLDHGIWSKGHKYVSIIYFKERSESDHLYWHGGEGLPENLIGKLK